MGILGRLKKSNCLHRKTLYPGITTTHCIITQKSAVCRKFLSGKYCLLIAYLNTWTILLCYKIWCSPAKYKQWKQPLRFIALFLITYNNCCMCVQLSVMLYKCNTWLYESIPLPFTGLRYVFFLMNIIVFITVFWVLIQCSPIDNMSTFQRNTLP
jgi:hypothetical protein